MSRAAIAILSTENLMHNVRTLRARAPHSTMIAMIKANAYGHGLRSTGQRLEKAGVENLGVASIDEALELRKAGVKIPITLMEGVFDPNELLIASCQNFHVVIHDQLQAQWLLATSVPVALKIWLKIDTGMGRLGLSCGDAYQIYQKLLNFAEVQHPVGIMSHLACAEDKDHPFNHQQLTLFDQFTRALSDKVPRSLTNSAAIINLPQHQYETVRPGLALYGVSPLPDSNAEKLDLRPVMTLQSRLISVRHFTKGSSVGYGGRFVCPEDMPVGVVAMGYGDGYPRTCQNGTPVLIHGIKCPTVGVISMDMLTVDLRACPMAKITDTVVLWGKNLPIEEVAAHSASSPYEMLCAMQSRVKFHWTQF